MCYRRIVLTLILIGIAFMNCQKSPEKNQQSLKDNLDIQANLVFFYYKDLADEQKQLITKLWGIKYE